MQTCKGNPKDTMADVIVRYHVAFNYRNQQRYKDARLPSPGDFMAADFELYVQGKKIPMNEFVSDLIYDVTYAILKNLHGCELEKITKVEIS